MTSHLLPPFLSCFKDDHVSIRMEATAVSDNHHLLGTVFISHLQLPAVCVQVAGSLKLRDKQVLQAIRGLLQDPCWKVKARALRGNASNTD